MEEEKQMRIDTQISHRNGKKNLRFAPGYIRINIRNCPACGGFLPDEGECAHPNHFKNVTLDELQELRAGYSKANNAEIRDNYVLNRNHAYDLNSALRNNEPLTEAQQATSVALDASMTELPEGINGFRAVNFPDGMIEGFEIGEIIPNAAFSSVSVQAEANEFLDRNTHIHMNIPAGTKAHITDNLPESEIILARGTGIEIISIEKDGHRTILAGRAVQERMVDNVTRVDIEESRKIYEAARAADPEGVKQAAIDRITDNSDFVAYYEKKMKEKGQKPKANAPVFRTQRHTTYYSKPIDQN